MDDLNAQQIVLLTLLVSFVTSIATGITTVSLLEQAPEPVTQTINRVVERTVERVVEVNEENNERQEKIVETIIVKEEDLTVEAVEKNSRSLVRIFKKIGDLETFASIGIVISNDGKVLTTSEIMDDSSEYVGVYPDSSKVLLNQTSSGERYSVLEIAPDQTMPQNFAKVSFGNSQNLKLGQSIIALSGQNSNMVSTGIVTSLETAEGSLDETEVDSSTVPTEEISVITTSVDPNKIVAGAILLNLQGDLVGFKRSSLSDMTSFSPSSQLISHLNQNGEVLGETIE